MMKRLLLLSVLALFLRSAANAYDFEAVNGDGVTIYYNILSSSNKTCEVTYKGQYYYSEKTYSGSVIIPEVATYNNDTYNVTTIGDYAFLSCPGLKDVTIPKSVTTIGDYVFTGDTGLTKFEVAEDNEYYCTMDGALFTKDMATLIQFPSVSPMTSYNIPNSVTTICEYAFDNCARLTVLTIGDNVTEIGDHAFDKCTSITGTLTIPNSVTSIGMHAFDYCKSLTEVIIGDGVTEIGYGAFCYCSAITKVSIGNSVTTINNWAFGDCTGLTEITIPESVTTIGRYAFRNCTGLRQLSIPNSVITIDQYAFEGCTGLKEVSIGNGVTEICDNAFHNCTGLTQVTIGNSVETIDNYAFRGCTSLKQVIIGNSVSTIGSSVFENCYRLANIYSLNPEPPMCSPYGYGSFYNVDTNTCVLYVPIGKKEIYSATYQWKDFVNIVEIDVTPVADILVGGNAEAEGYYTLDGKQVPTLQRGVNIIRYSDGTARKVLVK